MVAAKTVVLNMSAWSPTFGVPHIYIGLDNGQPTRNWPAYLGPNDAKLYWAPVAASIYTPLLQLTPNKQSAAGAIYWRFNYNGSFFIVLIGTFTNYTWRPADGYTVYLFISPETWDVDPMSNYTVPPTQLWHAGPIIGLPSSTPYLAIQWDPFWCRWYLYQINRGRLSLLNQSRPTCIETRPGDLMLLMVGVNPVNKVIVGFVGNLNTDQYFTFTSTLANYSLPRPGSYVFGIGAGTGGASANWALLYAHQYDVREGVFPQLSIVVYRDLLLNRTLLHFAGGNFTVPYYPVQINSTARYFPVGYYVNGVYIGQQPLRLSTRSPIGYYVVQPDYRLQYRVEVRSPLPVNVNGQSTKNYTGWVTSGAVLRIGVPDQVVLGNGTMFKPQMGNTTLVVDAPVSVQISWAPYYLVAVRSRFPIYVNGTQTSNYTSWVRAGGLLKIDAYNVTLGDALYVPTVQRTYVVRGPTMVEVKWTPYYPVSIISPIPVVVNGIKTTNYTRWLEAGSAVEIRVPSQVEFNNGTLFKPNYGNETLKVEGAVRRTITWTPYYLVKIRSQHPVIVNGVAATDYERYIKSGETVTISATPVEEAGGLVVKEPNATSLTITVNKPLSITISHSTNYTRLIAVVAGIVVAVAAAALFLRRRR